MFLAMVVVPASFHVDPELVRERAGAKNIVLASEAEFRSRFPGCESGAMPPFGNLYEMAVFVDESLARKQDIVFNAGTHNEPIQLAYADFEWLAIHGNAGGSPRRLVLVRRSGRGRRRPRFASVARASAGSAGNSAADSGDTSRITVHRGI
jgi:Aminoacyl-tRNA editing domain